MLASVLALGLSGCGKSQGDRLAQARKLVDKKDRAGAIIQLKSVIQEAPKLGEARLMLGTLLLDGGDAAAAEIELRRALELQLPEPQVVPVLARALLAAGKAALLVQQFDGVTWPDAQATAELKTALAQAHATLGNLPAARESLDRALRAAPQYEPALLLRARVTAVGGDLPGALQQVNDLLARSPGSADGWLLKGDMLGRQQAAAAGAAGVADTTEIVQAYRQSLQLRPDHPAAHAALISLHLAQRDADAANAQFEAMRKVLPKHPQTRLFEGQMAFLKGDLPRARELFQLLLRSAPDNLMLLQSAGAVELRLNAPAQAEVLLSKALQLAPGAVASRRLLAQSYLSLGQPTKALAVLEPLVGNAKTANDAEALTLAAQARLLTGDGAQAAALFERAAKLRPDDPKVRTAVALSHLSRGQGEQAIAELQTVASSDAGITADMALISTHLRRKAYEPALAAIAALDRKQPTRALAPHLRGQVLLLKRDTAGARQAFEQAVGREPTYYPSVASLAGLDYLEKKPDAARARFDTLIKADPRNGAARLAAAELASRTGAGREAVAKLLDEAVKANPGDATARLALVDHHLATSNAKAALVAAQAALAQLPDHFELLGRQGRAQIATGDHQQAVTTYNRMVALQGKSPLGYLGLAEAQMAGNDLGAASRSVKRALEVAPDDLPAQRLGITVALRQKQPAQALALAREVQRQRPDQAVGYLLEGEIESVNQRWDAALPPLRKAVTKADPAQAPERLHHVLGQLGKTAEADALAASWLKDHPRDMLFLFYLGDIALGRKDLAGAEQRYRAVLEVNPEHALSLNNIAWLMLEQKKPGALPYAERAVKAAPDQPALMDTLAMAYAAENQADKAIALQKRVLELRPEDPFLRLNLARFYVQAGEKRLAKAELDRLAVLGDRFPRQDQVDALLKGLKR